VGHWRVTTQVLDPAALNMQTIMALTAQLLGTKAAVVATIVQVSLTCSAGSVCVCK
jgi:hypothetical protein